MDKKYYMGIDVGSTTIKIYITDQNDECIFSKYERHYSDIQATIKSLIKEVEEKFGNLKITAVMTGSGGLALSECLGIKFVQEVIACTKTVETYIPECDVAIELGGEDAKITYFQGSLFAVRIGLVKREILFVSMVRECQSQFFVILGYFSNKAV